MRRCDKKIVVGRKEIERAGGIQAALDEALSLAALRMTPRALTAYEAVGSGPSEEDGAAVVVQIVVRDEEELREAIGAGAEAVLIEGVSAEEVRRLGRLRGGCAGIRRWKEVEGSRFTSLRSKKKKERDAETQRARRGKACR